MDLTEEQLKNSVIYLGCGLDFTPLTLFSDESDFFIFVDWNWYCWSLTREQCIETFTSKQIPEKKHQGLFRPLSGAGMKDRIDEECERKDWGLKEDITKKFDELNRRHNYDLEIVDEGRSVPLETIGFDANFGWPDNFQLTAQEQQDIDQNDTNQWAQQCTIRLGEKRLEMLFVCAEGLTAYSALFSSGKIAPKILVTDDVGMMGYTPLDDPNGITKRSLDCCVAKPLSWIHGGGKR